MKAVNQSVGRAIRHRMDWAAIYLVDFRFSSDKKILGGISKWLLPELKHQSGWGSIETEFSDFIRKMR